MRRSNFIIKNKFKTDDINARCQSVKSVLVRYAKKEILGNAYYQSYDPKATEANLREQK